VEEEGLFEVALAGVGAEGEEVEVVGVFEEVAGEIGLAVGEGSLEVGEGLALTVEEAAFDLEDEDVAAPALAEGLFDVPEAFRRVVEEIKEAEVVAPRQLCNRVLHNCRVGPGFGEGAHVFEIAGRKALDGGEGEAEVGGELVDDPGAPALLPLAEEDFAPEVPVEQDEFAVHREGGAELRRLDAGFEVGQQALVGRGGGQWVRHAPATGPVGLAMEAEYAGSGWVSIVLRCSQR